MRFFAILVAAVAVLALAWLPAAPAPAATVHGPGRIVSLLPSLTEDLFAIGAGPRVVGVSSYTDFPAAAARLPVVSSVVALDVERIVALRPDLVVAGGVQRRLVEPLRRAGLRVAFIDETSYDEIFSAIERLGALTDRTAAASALEASLRRRTAALAARVPRGPGPAVFVVVDLAPLYTAGEGSFMARLVELAGGRIAVGRLRLPYAPYGAEALVALQPDVVVGSDGDGLRGVLGRPPWSDLRAVRAHRVELIANADLLARPGPRYVEGLAWLVRALHPAAGGR